MSRGNRAIAEYLIEKGARPSLFSATMLGQLDVVKAFVAAQPGAERTRGPHSFSLLAHAKMGGAKAQPVVEFLQSLPGADQDAPAPLSAEDTAALVGPYVFGISPNQQVEVDADIRSSVLPSAQDYKFSAPMSGVTCCKRNKWKDCRSFLDFHADRQLSFTGMTVFAKQIVAFGSQIQKV